MGVKSRVATLPSAVKEWLDKCLVEGNFKDYKLLSAELKKHGHEISKSSLHRYGQDFESRLSRLKMVTEQARAVVMAAPDDDGAVNEALILLTQDKLFNVLMSLEVDVESVDITKLAKAVADLGKASVSQKKFQTEVRAKASAAAEAVEQIVKKSGLSADSVHQIRSQILGIAE